MSKNQSPYTVHVETDDGGVVAVAPGDDFPTGVKVDNPYVSGKQKADEADEELPPLPEAGDGQPVADAEEESGGSSRSSSRSSKS